MVTNPEQEGISEILQQFQEQLQENAMPGEVKQMLVGEREQLIKQAQVFFFCSETGHILSLEDYEEWREKTQPRRKIEELSHPISQEEESGFITKSSIATGGLQAGVALEGASDTVVERGAEKEVAEAPSSPAASPYSSNYQELVRMILAGEEIPGIKTIPSTVLEGARSEAAAAQRKKPWE